MASIKDVARHAGVSLMTVSRAINDPKLVRASTLERVQKVISELNYVPDLYARKVRSVGNINKTIGVLALDTGTTPFSVEITLSIEETARSFGWNSFVINMFNDDDPDKIVDLLLSHRPGGIIFTTMGLRTLHIPKKLFNYPLVLANCSSLDDEVASFIPHDYEGEYNIVKALLSAGYKKPLCLMLPLYNACTEARLSGMEKAMHECGIDPKSLDRYHMEFGDEHYLDIPSFVLKHLKNGKPDFDSVICGNDRIALMVYQTLMSNGIRIPEDVGVIGYDNCIGLGDLFYPSLSTVQIPHYELGKLATMHLINGNTHHDVVHVESPVIIRKSF